MTNPVAAPSQRFAGLVALISGAGTGIGAAVASRIVAEGGSVALLGRRPEPLLDTAEKLGARALVVVGDACVSNDVDRAIQETLDAFGSLSVVVANAGGHFPGTLTETDDAAWRGSMTANLDTAFVTARQCLPELKKTRGNLVVISSIAGLFAGPGVVGYVTSKHAVIGLTRSIARDYGRFGVRANAVCPGWVRTAMADEEMDELGARTGLSRDDSYALVTKDTPLQRAAAADEIASVVAFLASGDASAVTGSVVVADCGAGCVDLPTIAFAD